MVERGGWYLGGEKRTQALQNHGEKGEEWRTYVVLEGGHSRYHRGNRPTVVSWDLVVKTKMGRGRCA